MEVTPVQSFVTGDHAVVVEKLYLKRLAVTVARRYFSPPCLVGLPHLPADLTATAQGSVVIPKYRTTAMATTKLALSVLSSRRKLAYVERRR